MNNLKDINFDELIEKVIKNRCEVSINIEPDRTEITIQPWKPFTYSCPFKNGNCEENEE